MKAAVFYGADDMRIMDVPKPACPPGGALVRLSGSLICGTDTKIYKNGHPRITPPQIIGHESCGVLEAIDAPDYAIAPGERVTLQTSIPCGKCDMCQRGIFNLCESIEAISWKYAGTFAEYVAVPRDALALGNLIRVPESLPDAQACLAEPLACVINGQELVGIVPGETVLVIGAGPIGILHAELARISGAGRIVIAEQNPARIGKARTFGYSAYIDTSREDMAAAIKSMTGGKGADVTIVTAPAKAAQEQAFETVAPRGRLSLFGSLPSGKSTLEIDSRTIHYKEIRVAGAASSTAYQMKKALSILATGQIRADMMITHTLPLDNIVKGLTLAMNGEALKVYLKN